METSSTSGSATTPSSPAATSSPRREAFRILIEQGRGGSIVFVGSKNALVAGANAAAYSSAKAASLHLARCLAEEGGPQGIRVNTVNPDAVIQGSSIWSSDWKAERASTYGVSEDELQTHLQEPDEARRRRPAGGRRRGDRVLRRAPIEQVHRQRRQRRRRRHRRLSPVVRRRRTIAFSYLNFDSERNRQCICTDGQCSPRCSSSPASPSRLLSPRPSRQGGGQDLLLHSEGHAEPVRGDR